MENSILDGVSPAYGFSNAAKRTGTLSRINTEYDRSLEQTPLDQYEIEANIARTQPEVEKKKHNWRIDAYNNFLNKRDEISLMTERAKIVNEIDPKIKEIDTLLENASITSSDDTLKGELEKNRESLLEEKQKVLDTINSIEKDVEERKKIGISASYQANEMLSQDKSLLNPDYWLYSVPGTMGSSFSDASSYAYGFIGWGIKAAASALAAPFTGGSSLLPLVINTAGTLAAIGSSVIGTDKSNRSEALAETYGAYKDRVNKELQDKGTSLQDLAATVRSKMPIAEANKYTDDQIADKIITGEIPIDDATLSDSMNRAKTNLDAVYNRNRSLVMMDQAQNLLLFGRVLGVNQAIKTITKPIGKAALSLPAVGSAVKRGNKIIDDVIGWNTKLALKNPVKHGLTNVPKSLMAYGISSIGEGFEEGSQNIFNRDYIRGAYDEESSSFLKSYSDLISANYRVAKILSGIDTESELAKDPDFWNEVKGGVALGLFMGAAPTIYNSVVGTAKEIAANKTVRDLTADNLSKKDMMNRIGIYADKSTKGFGNYFDEMIDLFEKYKKTDLPDGVTEKDIDDEINLAKTVRSTTNDKDFNNLANAAGFNKGSDEYKALIGLRNLSKIDAEEANSNLIEFAKKYNSKLTEYFNDPAWEAYPESIRDSVKRKTLMPVLISSLEDWLNNMESKPSSGSRKYGILNSDNPVAKRFMKNIKNELLNLHKAYKEAEDNLEGVTTHYAPDPSKELIDAFVGSLLAKSDVENSAENMHLLHSEKRFKRMDDADKADVVKRIQDKVKGYFGNLEETNSIFEQNLRNDQDITDDTEEAVHNGPGVMPTPEPSPAAAAPESTPIQTAATAPTSPAPTSPAGTATADQTGSQDVNVGQNAAVAEEEPAKDVETEDEGNADTYTEDNGELDINTVDEGEINISTEESPAVDISTVETPTTEIQTDETNAVVEFNTEEEHEAHVEDLGISNTAAVTTEDTVPTESNNTTRPDTHESILNSGNIDDRIKESNDFFNEVDNLPKKDDENASNDEKEDADKVRMAIENKFVENEGTNSSNIKEALHSDRKRTTDKISNTLFYAPNSDHPLMEGYEPGKELLKLLDTPDALDECSMRFIINPNYTPKGAPKYEKGKEGTYDGASLLLEITHGKKKYLLAVKSPAEVTNINNNATAINTLRNNRSSIIKAIESNPDKDVVPTKIIISNGKYNQNVKINEDGSKEVIHRPLTEVKGLKVPSDIEAINGNTVDIAIGRGVRGEPAFSLFDKDQQLRTGKGGSGQIFYMAKKGQTLSGNEVPIQLNAVRFTDDIVNFLYNLITGYSQSTEFLNGTYVEANEILLNLINFGDDTIVSDSSSNLQFLVEKQLYYDEGGLLHVGNKAYNVTNITPEQEKEIKDALKNFHWKINKETFWNKLGDVFKSVKSHFEREGDEKVEIIPGIPFKKEHFIGEKSDKVTMMGWMISNGLITCDLKDQLFTGAFVYYEGVHVRDKVVNDSVSTGELNNLMTADGNSTVQPVDNTNETVPAVDTTVKENDSISEDQLTDEDKKAIDQLEQLTEGFDKNADIFDIIQSGGAATFGDQYNDSPFGQPRKMSLMKSPEKKVTKEEIQWFKNKLGLNAENLEFVDQAIALGNDVFAMGLCKLYSTVLWKGAEQGTLYHEAFHKVSLLLLSPQERRKIYNYYKKLHNTEDVADSEIEEALAEEFRDFMLNKNSAKLNVVKRLFNKIKFFLSRWFNRSDYNITRLFNRINSGHYAQARKNPESVREWLQKFKEDGAAPFIYKGVKFENITNTQVEEIVKALSSASLVLNKVQYSGDVGKINLSAVKYALNPERNKKAFVEGHITEEQSKVRNEIYAHFDDVFKPLIIEELASYKIRRKSKQFKDEEAEQKASGDETGDEMAKYTKQSFEISSKQGALPAIKLLIASLTRYTPDPTARGGYRIARNNATGLMLTVDFDRAWSRISSELANYKEFDEMMDGMIALGKHDPLFYELHTKLTKLTEYSEKDDEATKIAKENLKTQFRNTFKKHKSDYVFCLIKDVKDENGNTSTEVVFKNENKNKIIGQTIEMWTNNLLGSDLIVFNSEKGFTANTKKIEELREFFAKFVEKSKTELNQNNLLASKSWLVNMLANFGIFTDITTLNNILRKHYNVPNDPTGVSSFKLFLTDTKKESISFLIKNRMKDLLSLKGDSFKISASNKNYNRELSRVYKDVEFLHRLAYEYSETHPSADELSVRTTDDKIFYSITENNYFFDHIDELNEDKELLDRTINVVYNGGINKYNTVKGSYILDTLKNTTKKLKSQVFSGFKRDGSGDPGRSYSEISPLEDMVIKMSLTRNGYIVLPTMGDSVSYSVLYIEGEDTGRFNQPIKIENGVLQFDYKVLDAFANYFETEIDTILFNYANPPKEEKDIIKNYDTGKRWGYKFRYFADLVNGRNYNNDLADAEKLDDEAGDKNYTNAKRVINDISEKWKKHKAERTHYKVINDYLTRELIVELQAAAKLGLIEFDGKNLKSIKNIAIPSSFIDETIKRYSHIKNAEDKEFYATLDIMMNYIANSQASEIEFTKLFNKDPAYYKDDKDLLKRRREVYSTGITPRTEYSENADMNNLKEFTIGTFKDNVIASRQIKQIKESATRSYAFDKLQREKGLTHEEAVKAIESNDSKYATIFDEARALADRRFKGYTEVNQTDATVLLSPEGYKQLVRRTVGWTPEVAAAFDVLNDASILTDENSELYHKSLNTILAPLKCMYFGGRFNDELRREIPIFDKMALFPVFPVFATGDMKVVLERMTDKNNPVHMIAFESAVKVGQDKNAELYKDGKVVDINELNKMVTHKQPLKYFRKQMVTDPHDSAHDQMFVSQAFKASLLNVRKNNEYVTPKGDKVTGKKLFESLFSCMNILTSRGADKIKKEFGVTEDEDGVKSANPAAVAKNLRRSAVASKMNQNVLDGLEIVNGKPKAPISGLSDNPWMESALISEINSSIIDINTPGGMFIQMSSVAYNDLTIRSDGGMRDLKFDNSDGTVECVISINLLKNIIPDYDKKSFVEAKKWLIDHEVIGRDRAAMAIGYRIPAQGPSSVAALKVVDVYPENIGDTITLPDEWTALTGSDRIVVRTSII